MTPKIVILTTEFRVITWHSYVSLSFDPKAPLYYCIGEYSNGFTLYFKTIYDRSKGILKRSDTDIGCNVLRREGLKQIVKKQWH